jgi:riboflavin biosynthesis pyrimidine reductase
LLRQVTDAFGSIDLDLEGYLKELISGLPITASLVCDENGNTVGKDGSSKGLGNQTDLALLIALRRKSQVVLTSGRTFTADQYRFPKHADLAVLSNGPVSIEVPAGQRLLEKKSGYTQALLDLKADGYSRIHVEYGLTGIGDLVANRVLDGLFLSSTSRAGLDQLAFKLGVSPLVIELADLYIGLVAWQPKLAITAR